MNVIIPMAGIGKRMRPHTLTVPKPLLPIAGKPIVQSLVEDIAVILDEKIDNVGFVVSPNFGKEVEDKLYDIAVGVGAKAKIYYQEEARGTAHAIICAADLLIDHVVIAFADTLFRAHFSLDSDKDGIIWVKKVKDPTGFGVVKVNKEGIITEFAEKPESFVSDLAIIGIYYFKNGDILRDEINYVIDNDIKDKGEYQLTSALENMKSNGAKFSPGQVDDWLDCGNKDVTVNTNKQYLEFVRDEKLIADSAVIENSALIQPVFIGENVKIMNSVVGPHVSLGEGSKIVDSRIKNCIIQTHTNVKGANLENSMLGNFVNFEESPEDLSLGDYSSKKRFR